MIDYILNMVWTVSAGLLSLVALLGIFVSISSQQKIQKRRELFWELFQPDQRSFERGGLSKEQIVDNARYLQKKYRLYSHLEINESKGILPIALDAAVFLILTVIVFWGIGAILALLSWYSKAVSSNASNCDIVQGFLEAIILGSLFFLGTVALQKTRVVMELLRFPWKNEELPSIKKLLNVCNTAEAVDVLDYLINTLLVSLRLIREDNKDWIQLKFSYPLPFYGFSVMPELRVHYRDQSEKTYRNGNPFAVKYDDSRSSSGSAKPIIFIFELADGAKERISTINVSVKIRAGERDKDVNVEGEIDISTLNDWSRPNVFVLSRMTKTEMKVFDDHNIVVCEKIEKS